MSRQETEQTGPKFNKGLGFANKSWICSVNENHPVLLSLDAELDQLRSAYIQQPNEQPRYQLVRLEQLIHQWAPGHSSNG